jgi:hypothetical protein
LWMRPRQCGGTGSGWPGRPDTARALMCEGRPLPELSACQAATCSFQRRLPRLTASLPEKAIISDVIGLR